MANKKETPVKDASTKSMTQVVEEIKPQADKGMDFATKLQIRSQKDLELAKDYMTRANAFGKQIVEKRNGFVNPAKQIIANAKAIFDPIEERLKGSVEVIKSKMLTYNRKIQQEAAEKQAKIEVQVEKGEIAPEKAGEKLEKIQDKVDAVPTRKVLKMTITDEKLVPEQYWMIDTVKLRADAILAFQAGKEIPGAKVVEEEIIVSGR